MRLQIRILLLLVTCMLGLNTEAAPTIVYTNKSIMTIGGDVDILQDTSNKLTIENVVNAKGFQLSTQAVPNLGVSTSSFWLHFIVQNETDEPVLLLEVAHPTLDEVEFYTRKPDGNFDVIKLGEYKPFNERLFKHQNYVIELPISKGETREYYLRVKSGEQVMMPLHLGEPRSITRSIMERDLVFGIFFGLLLVMLLYNLFIYFTVRDSIYLYYVLYILVTMLNQGALQGYTFRYLWPDSPGMAMASVYLFPALAGFAAMLFAKVFLNTKLNTPRLNKGLNFLMGIFLVCMLLVFFKMYNASFGIMQLNTMVGSLYVLYISVVISRLGYRPAKFFLLAWTALLVGATIFVLKDFGVLPYTNLTASTLELGSALEVVLLSFALADKINIFRKEKEESQQQALLALEENSRIVREQNIILEAKVNERTIELKESNNELSKTLVELKEAEMQLVESEKMASLGQLTAGIAHEINNPINFVTSNVKPLKRDFEMIMDMLSQIEGISLSGEAIEQKQEKIAALKEEFDYDYLKTEIDYLLNGISEGSSRTAEIVKGLRIFSRLDEDDLKKANINEGIDSTLVIVNNILDKIEIVRAYGEIPQVECFPGKLNQVFLNIVTNAIHAIKKHVPHGEGGKITITTSHSDDRVKISIADNGTGMDENTKKKLFEPFFTTKDVGEGTGLGLSIAYNTIKKHNGTIEVNSEIGAGTEFIIEIPIIHQ